MRIQQQRRMKLEFRSDVPSATFSDANLHLGWHSRHDTLARWSLLIDISLVQRKVTGPAARGDAFPSGAGSWWQMSLALVPRKVKPSELDEDDWCWRR